MISRIWLLSISLTLFFSTVLAEDFKDFRIPDHRIFTSGVSAQGMYDWGKSDLNQAQRKNSSAFGDLSGGLFWLKDSDIFRSETHLSAALSRNRDESKTDNYAESETSEDVNSYPRESASMSWDGWYYPAKIPVGVYAGASGHLQSNRSNATHTGTWSAGGVDFVHTRDSEFKYLFRAARLSGGIVYGRVRDATTVYQVRIIEQRLIETGVLKGELASQTRQKIAGLFYNRKNYQFRYERPDRFFWRDIEEALASDPAFNASWVVRRCGWSAGPVIEASHSYDKRDDITREFVRYSSPDSSGVDTLSIDDYERDSFEDNVKLGLQAAYYLPLNLRWQIDFISSFYRYVQPENNGFTLETSANVYYEIADRWRASGAIQHLRAISDPSPDEPSSYLYPYRCLSVDAGIDYYIESRTALSLSLDYSRSKYSQSQTNADDYRSNGVMASIGITYSFTGYLYSPPDRYFTD
jgi:hypothetical protein